MYQNVGVSEGHKRCIVSAWESTGGMRVVFFSEVLSWEWGHSWVSGHAGTLGSAEPARCHHPADGDSEHCCSHHGSTAWWGQRWSYSWTACSSRARGQKPSVMVVTCSVHGGSFLSTSSQAWEIPYFCWEHAYPLNCCREVSAYFRGVSFFSCSEWCSKCSGGGHFLIIKSICEYSSDKEGWASAYSVCLQSLALFPLHQRHRGMNNAVFL